ncbi:MAG: tetratricopeptide repeat protein [Dysgonamonadaceae bacterium]|jgi:tetratricopeptide (TPR) repeat protein|nr:tetratricopeptide repeat protein [Dysgonamonadaceae bacterium]
MKKTIIAIFLLLASLSSSAQLNTDRVMMIGRNALYFEDYVLAIQYFNQVIEARPHLAQPFYFRAVAKFMLDDFEGAEEDATACLDRNPFFLAAYQLRGAARQNLGKFDLAAADYQRSLEFFPEDRLTLINMAIVNIELKYFDVAEQFFDILLRRYPEYTPAFVVRSQMFLEQNDTTRAMADLNRAIEIDPFMSQSYSMRGLLHFQQRDFENSLADLNEAIHLDPYFVGNYINRGLVQYHLNNLREAMANYDRVIEMDGRNLIARFNRGLLRAQVADNNNAIEDFNKVIELEPNNMMAFLNRAMLNTEIGNTVAALNDLDVVLAEHTDFFSGFYMRAQLKRELGDLRGAERDFNFARAQEARARQIAVENPDPLEINENERDTREQSDRDIERFNLLVVADRTESSSNRGNTHQRQSRGRVQNISANVTPESRFVITYYERDREVPRPVYFSPLIDDANRTLGLSWILRATNNEASLNELQIQAHFRSIDNYFRRLDTDPNNPVLYFGRGMDFMLIQDYENALDDINKVIELNPDLTIAYFVRAVIRSKQLEFNPFEAQDLFSASQSSSIRTPERTDITPGVLPRLPEISTRSFEHDIIMKDYEKVIAMNPSFFFAHYNIAEIFTLEKDYRAAISAYTRAIELEPQFAEAYFNRGVSRLSIGETATGLDDLRKAGQLGIVQAYSIIARMRQ